MSLFGALSELLGGAVLACATACDLVLPPGLEQERRRFAEWLGARTEATEARRIIEALGGEIWVGAETRGLAQRDLEAHAAATAILVTAHKPSAAALADVAASLRAGPSASGSRERTAGQRVTADIVRRAREAGAFAGGHPAIAADVALNEDVVAFLLGRTFAHLVDERALLKFGAALGDFAGEAHAAAPVETNGLAVLGLSRAFTLQLELVGGPAFLADLAERFGIAERAVRRVVALIDSQSLPPEARMARLEQLAQWLSEARAQLARPTNEDAEVRRLKAIAAEALADGDFEAASDALRHVRQELREVRRRTEERLQDEAAALRAQMVEEARATARLAELMVARNEHDQAAVLFAEAAVALPRSDRETAWKFSLKRATALLEAARSRGDAAVLAETITAFSGLVRLAAESTDSKALTEALLGHGDALALAGDRDADTTRLADAVTIYKKAIELIERVPDATGMVHARIAVARSLARIGERNGSSETLSDAADAHRKAIAAVTAERASVDRAALHLSLGSVLLSLEERGGGTELLSEAATAYRAAIGLIDSETEEDRWGEAQMSLGLALLGLGEQLDNKDDLEAAVAAFNTALDVTARVKASRRWALIQMNLGNALAALGDRDAAGTARLDAAVQHYHLALEELLVEAEPMKWAITQMNLGTVLIRLGERQDQRKNWLAAASALVPALEVFEVQNADALAELTRRNLKRLQESWDVILSPRGGRAEAPLPPAGAAGPVDHPGLVRPRLVQAG